MGYLLRKYYDLVQCNFLCYSDKLDYKSKSILSSCRDASTKSYDCDTFFNCRIWPRSAGSMVEVSRKDIQYMKLCVEIASIFSTCSKRQYGSILVDSLGHVVGMGYNGGPSGFAHCVDGACPRALEGSPNGSSYDNCFAVHAEANALLHSNYSSSASKLYVNGPPCFSCAKLIANSTIKKVYYKSDDSYVMWNEIEAFLNKAGVETYKVVLNASI